MRPCTVAIATAVALLLVSPAEARPWSDTTRSDGSFGPADAAYYQAELGVPVTFEPGLKLRLNPEAVFGLVTKYILTPVYDPENRIVSVEATSDVPDLILKYVFPHNGPVWKLKMIGRYPAAPPPCPPPVKGLPRSCPPPGPDYVDPTIVVRDLDGSALAIFR